MHVVDYWLLSIGAANCQLFSQAKLDIFFYYCCY